MGDQSNCTQLISEISYEEVAEIASLGARIIHPRAAQIAAKHNLIIRVANANNPLGRLATQIGPYRETSKSPVIAACITDVSLLTFENIEKKTGTFALLLHKMLANNFTIRTVVHNITNEPSGVLNLVLPEDESKAFVSRIKGISEIPTLEKSYSLISVVGLGMENTVGVATNFFNACKKARANIRLMSSTSISQSILVNREVAKETYLYVCDAFKLL